MTSSQRSSGFTLIEVIFVLAVTVPLLLVLGSIGRAAVGSVTASERAGTTTDVLVRSMAEVERTLRFGGRETRKTPATSDDVRLRRARTVGDWIALPAGEPRTQIQVTSLTGEGGSRELQIPKRLHTLRFVLDPRETLDGIDNDRDGMVDEGVLQSTVGSDTRVLLKNLERCTFERDGHTVHITLTCVRPGHGRTLQRTTLRSTVFLINP